MASQYTLEARARILASEGYGVEDIRVKLQLSREDEGWIRRIVFNSPKRDAKAS